jgi:putative tryptophan/tyrosine transport system substrate-binding protein
MRRREFMTVLGGAAVGWPLAARAQGERVRRIGVLMGIAESDPARQSFVAAFTEALQELRWSSGRNIRIEYRWGAGDAERIRDFARELVEMQLDLIVGHTTPVVAALKAQTRTIPIVFTQVSDPVGSGFIDGFAKPGGNITGFTNLESSMGSKLGELLKEVAPTITRVAVMFNPDTAPDRGTYFLRPVEAAAPSLHVEVIPAPVHNDAEIESAITTLVPGTGLIVMLSPGRRLCGASSQGREACRSAGATADQIRVGDQPQDREGARARGAGSAARSRRRGDRIN